MDPDETGPLHDSLADRFERVARALRAGDAAVYGYDVRLDDGVRESGAVRLDGEWLAFGFESRRTVSYRV